MADPALLPLPTEATDLNKKLLKDPTGKTLKLKWVKKELAKRKAKVTDLKDKKKDIEKAIERLQNVIEPDVAREADLRQERDGSDGAKKYPPFPGALADGRDIEGLKIEELRAELKKRYMFKAAHAKKREMLIDKVWDVVEEEYVAEMEREHHVPTFQEWRQAANASKPLWTDRKDLHRRMVEAAFQGNMWELQTCLEEGADVNFQDDVGDTVLMTTAAHGRLDMVELLLWFRADVDCVNKMGQTALVLAGLRRNHRVLQAIRKAWREQRPQLTLPTIPGNLPHAATRDDAPCTRIPSTRIANTIPYLPTPVTHITRLPAGQVEAQF